MFPQGIKSHAFWSYFMFSQGQGQVVRAAQPRQSWYLPGVTVTVAWVTVKGVTVKASYRVRYFEIVDLAVAAISEWFDQPGFKVFSQMEQFLLECVQPTRGILSDGAVSVGMCSTYSGGGGGGVGLINLLKEIAPPEFYLHPPPPPPITGWRSITMPSS